MKEEIIERTNMVIADIRKRSMFTAHDIRGLSEVGIPIMAILGEKEVVEVIEKAVYKWINKVFKDE